VLLKLQSMNRQMPLDLLRANAGSMAEKLKLLSHPERLLMLCRMSDGEVTVTELVELTDLSQSAVSQHLAKFRDCGLVAVRRNAQARHYRLADEDVRQILLALCDICDPNGKEPSQSGSEAE
jgi:DNA-binding transcriptional ArsR family regulator